MVEVKTCSVADCDRSVYGHGMCKFHYQRWYRRGDPLLVVRPKGVTVMRRVRDFPPPTPQTTPCRIWQGPLHNQGYGLRRGRAAHRWVMEQALGRRLGRFEVVMHLCDNPPCFRFEHLQLGTLADNNADMKAKERHARGEVIGGSKLTAEQVAEIVNRVLGGERQADLAREMGVSRHAVNDIIKGRSWAHVTGLDRV